MPIFRALGPTSGPDPSFPPLPDLLPNFPEPPSELPTFPFPQPLPMPQPFPLPFPPLRFLRCGCYLINYTPTSGFLTTYDGTLRVECHTAGRTASGDLYQRGLIFSGTPPLLGLAPAPNPASGIPILARNRYRFYLRVTQVLESWTFGNQFTLGFEMHRFDLATKTWTNNGAFTALMKWVPAPPGYPAPNDYLVGDVKNAVNTIVGSLKMGWISQYLRKATVEIDRVAQSEAPLDNGAGINWKAVGDGIGWQITTDSSDANVVEPSGESWSNAECHQAMLARRDASNLDTEWRYHVLAVRRLDATERGIMYDNGATDSNNVPREGCAVSSHWVIPNTASWGLVRGLRFGTATQPYYRTAVHETGHAMGLYHNTIDNGYMNTTDVIAASATPGNPFPNNVQWTFAADDQKRLRHMPDVYVRPGGTPFGTSYATTPISPTDLAFDPIGLRLSVAPLLETIPLGAPVRVDVSLSNDGETAFDVPPTLSLGSGFVRGQVIDTAGVARDFSPLVLCVDELPLNRLEPGQTVTSSLTLLRGAQGTLFPAPGIYRIRVEAHWDAGGAEAVVSGETNVMVTSAVDEAHARAALKVLTTPDVLLSLVLGGDHLQDGIAAIQTALENPVLRPHFAHIEAKRLAERFGKRKPDLKAAATLIDAGTVMSRDEIGRAASLAKTGGEGAPAKTLAKTLKEKAAASNLSDEQRTLVAEL